MINTNTNYNPKALDVDAIIEASNYDAKITLGFKCDPLLKLQLVEDAEQIGLTLSNYVESLVNENNDLIQSFTESYKETIETLNKSIGELTQTIAFYENNILIEMYEIYKGRIIEFKNAKKQTINLEITSVQDIYTVIINSFKINNND